MFEVLMVMTIKTGDLWDIISRQGQKVLDWLTPS